MFLIFKVSFFLSLSFICFFSLFFLKASHYKNISTLSNSTNIKSKLDRDPLNGLDADEGFASSSSIEEDQIFEVIRRKRNSYALQQTMEKKRSSLDFKMNPIHASRKILEEKISMAPLESILWIVSFLWVFYQLYIDGDSTFSNNIMAGNYIFLIRGVKN